MPEKVVASIKRPVLMSQVKEGLAVRLWVKHLPDVIEAVEDVKDLKLDEVLVSTLDRQCWIWEFVCLLFRDVTNAD
jgi:hypothetical protein